MAGDFCKASEEQAGLIRVNVFESNGVHYTANPYSEPGNGGQSSEISFATPLMSAMLIPCLSTRVTCCISVGLAY